MKLYIWNEPYELDYGFTLLIVVARNLREAKLLAKNGDCYRFGIHQKEKTDKLNLKLGKPDRVVSLPCAEWHEWEE